MINDDVDRFIACAAGGASIGAGISFTYSVVGAFIGISVASIDLFKRK